MHQVELRDFQRPRVRAVAHGVVGHDGDRRFRIADAQRGDPERVLPLHAGKVPPLILRAREAVQVAVRSEKQLPVAHVERVHRHGLRHGAGLAQTAARVGDAQAARAVCAVHEHQQAVALHGELRKRFARFKQPGAQPRLGAHIARVHVDAAVVERGESEALDVALIHRHGHAALRLGDRVFVLVPELRGKDQRPARDARVMLYVGFTDPRIAAHDVHRPPDAVPLVAVPRGLPRFSIGLADEQAVVRVHGQARGFAARNRPVVVDGQRIGRVALSLLRDAEHIALLRTQRHGELPARRVAPAALRYDFPVRMRQCAQVDDRLRQRVLAKPRRRQRKQQRKQQRKECPFHGQALPFSSFSI